MARQPKRRGRVILVALTVSESVVDEQDLSVEDYYDGGCELIDSSEYRASRGVRVVKGEIYDPKGNLDQRFENRYSEAGALIGSRSVFADGQVIER